MNKVVVGDNFAKRLAAKLNLPYVKIFARVFPDLEIQPKLAKEIRARTSILLLRKRLDEDVNSYLIKFYLLARKLRESSKKVIGIMPYFPYARQDKIFRPGEPLSAKYIAELLERNLDLFITVNAHEHRKKLQDFFKIKVINISAFQRLAQEFKSLKNPFALGPDLESEKYVLEFVKGLKAEFGILEKERHVATGQIKFAEKKLDLQGKNVIIVDDLVSTGGTLLQAARVAKKFGARSISLAFVHGPLVPDVQKLLKAKFRKIVTTNTIQTPFARVDVIPEIVSALKRI